MLVIITESERFVSRLYIPFAGHHQNLLNRVSAMRKAGVTLFLVSPNFLRV
jgi:hypothetical protein